MTGLITPSMTFIDLGANIGQHTLMAASIVGREGRVISFEPQQKVRDFLLDNVRLNNFENVTVLP